MNVKEFFFCGCKKSVAQQNFAEFIITNEGLLSMRIQLTITTIEFSYLI